MDNKITQADSNIPDDITYQDIINAAKDYDEKNIVHRFIDSRDYDVIINNKYYPPKAIIGLASNYKIGRPLLPAEFSAGHDKKCFKILKEFGFDIVPKLKDVQEIQLDINSRLTNNELINMFKCGNMGGMRRAKETNSLILIVNHTKSIYKDKWEGDTLYYSGMGKKGDQTLTHQNKTLFNSRNSDISIHLFEVIKQNEYIYRGLVHLSDEPYEELHYDEDNKQRKVFIFPLKLNNKSEISISELETINNDSARLVKKLSIYDLKNKIKDSTKISIGYRNTITKTYDRNQLIVQYAKYRSNGICELCNKEAPFRSNKDEPYLEVHHIKPLSENGEDSINNVVALCPNCHRKMHIVKDIKDIEKLVHRAFEDDL